MSRSELMANFVLGCGWSFVAGYELAVKSEPYLWVAYALSGIALVVVQWFGYGGSTHV